MSITSKAALVLRPIPSDVTPKDWATHFGGLPQLPEDLLWPVCNGDQPQHFIAQINLGALPRNTPYGHDVDPVPDLPDEGALFIFMPLVGDSIHAFDPVVLFTPENVADLPVRQPPESLGHPGDDMGYVDLTGVSEDGRVLVRQAIEVIPFVSDRDGENWKSALCGAEASGKAAKPSSVASQTEAIVSRIPEEIRDTYPRHDLTDEDLTWSFLTDWAVEFHRLIQGERRAIEWRIKQTGKVEREGPKYWPWERLFKKLKAAKPPEMKPAEDLADEWLAQTMGQDGVLPAEVSARFVETMIEIQAVYAQHLAADHHGPGDAITMRAVRGAASKALTLAAGNATEDREQRRLSGTPTRIWDERSVRETAPEQLKSRPIQMFGYGAQLQSAAGNNADKVLLFQHGGGFGTPVLIGDMLVQFWIETESLAQAEFSNVNVTVEMG